MKNLTIIFPIFVVLLGIQIVDFELHEETNQISVIFRQSMGFVVSEDGISQDRIWREIYGVENGKIILLKKTEGKLTPARWIEEKIIFDEPD